MNAFLSAAAWLELLSQLLMIMVGGALVLFTNWISERRRNHREEEMRRRKESAILTGVFAVRNLLATELDARDGEPFGRDKLPVLHAAQRNLHSLLNHSEPSSQIFVAAIFEISLRLDVLISIMEADEVELDDRNQAFSGAFNAAVDALVMFDIAAHSSLEFLSEEDLSRFEQYVETENPESQPDRPG